MPPLLGVSQHYVERGGKVGGVSQVNAALSTIGRYRGYRSYTVANRGVMGH